METRVSEHRTPWVMPVDELASCIDNDDVVIIDMSRSHVYGRNHIPGAIHLDYGRVICNRPPVMGLLPDAEHLSTTFASLGIQPDSHVVVYDDEGGGKASRMLWTLEAAGHRFRSLLNGGLQAWINAGLEISHQKENAHTADPYPVRFQADVIADKNYILEHLDDPDIRLVDARSADEYHGIDKRAQRAGHIPEAVNIDWKRTMDQHHFLRLRSDDELLALYLPHDIVPHKEIITYCHSHRRSAHSYVVLKHLGYPHVRGYPGGWSDWGNDPGTPLEI